MEMARIKVPNLNELHLSVMDRRIAKDIELLQLSKRNSMFNSKKP